MSPYLWFGDDKPEISRMDSRSCREPDYLVELANDADVRVLRSKEWFEWDDDSKPLQARTGLVFRLKSELTYKERLGLGRGVRP